jgi:hypothetical protein
MRKFLLLLAVLMPCFDAVAQHSSQPFLFAAIPVEGSRWGLGHTDDTLFASSNESVEEAREYCMQAAASVLISYLSNLPVEMASILPQSPIAPPRLTLVYPAYRLVGPSHPTYTLKINACIARYEIYDTSPPELPQLKEQHVRYVAVSMPSFEHLLRGATLCRQEYGHEPTDHQEQCIRTIVEQLEK